MEETECSVKLKLCFLVYKTSGQYENTSQNNDEKKKKYRNI